MVHKVALWGTKQNREQYSVRTLMLQLDLPRAPGPAFKFTFTA